MANLRGLLGKEFDSTVLETAGTFGSYEKIRDGKVYNFAPHCNTSCDIRLLVYKIAPQNLKIKIQQMDRKDIEK